MMKRIPKLLILGILFYMNLVQAQQIEQEKYAIVNNLGKLYFSEHDWKIEYTMDIKEYLYTGLILSESIRKLSKICDTFPQIHSCIPFLQHVREYKINLSLDIAKLRAFNHAKRSKRFIFSLKEIFELTPAGTMAAKSLGKLGNLLNEVQVDINPFKQGVDADVALLHLQKSMAKSIDNKMQELQGEIEKLNHTVHCYQRFNEIIQAVKFTMIEHNNNKRKLDILFSNTIGSRFYDVVDFDNFTREIGDINTRLYPNFTLPRFTEYDILDFASFKTSINDTHLFLNIIIPILHVSSSIYAEIIPILIREGNNTFLIKSDVVRFIRKENQIFVISKSDISDHCIWKHNLLICNTFLGESLKPPTECIKHVILYNNDTFCNHDLI